MAESAKKEGKINLNDLLCNNCRHFRTLRAEKYECADPTKIIYIGFSEKRVTGRPATQPDFHCENWKPGKQKRAD